MSDLNATKERQRLTMVAASKMMEKFYHAIRLLGKEVSITTSYHLPPDMRLAIEVSWEGKTIWGLFAITAPNEKVKDGKRIVLHEAYMSINGGLKTFLDALRMGLDKANDRATAKWWGAPENKKAKEVPSKEEDKVIEVVVKDTVQNKTVVIDSTGQTRVITKCPDTLC